MVALEFDAGLLNIKDRSNWFGDGCSEDSVMALGEACTSDSEVWLRFGCSVLCVFELLARKSTPSSDSHTGAYGGSKEDLEGVVT